MRDTRKKIFSKQKLEIIWDEYKESGRDEAILKKYDISRTTLWRKLKSIGIEMSR